MESQHGRVSVELTIWTNNENKGYHRWQQYAPESERRLSVGIQKQYAPAEANNK